MIQFFVLDFISISVIVLISIFVLFKTLKGIWTCCLGHRLGFGVRWRSGPSVWAVVTGSTDGIGLQYAYELAERGYSLLLISRNEEKLNKVALDVKNKFAKKCHQVKN